MRRDAVVMGNRNHLVCCCRRQCDPDADVRLADEILELTQVGVNRMTVGDQTYRFFRRFTYIAYVGAVIFVPA